MHSGESQQQPNDRPTTDQMIQEAGMTHRLRTMIATFAALGLAAVLAAPAGAAFPDKPLEFIAPYPPGGAADTVSRLLANALAAELGQPVTVVNKPGGGTVIGAQAAKNAAPDGYTLFLGTNSTFMLNSAVRNDLPYDGARDFEAVGMIGEVPLGILVRADSPFQDLAQLVAAAKADPQKYNYASYGNATVPHFAGEMFKTAAGITMQHIPYQGSAPAMNDLLGGRVQVSFDTLVAAVPQLEAGRIRVLAVTTTKRSPKLPTVPTVAESGYPGYDISSWAAVLAPRGLPAPVKAKLVDAMRAALAKPEVQSRLRELGYEPSYDPLANWADLVPRETGRMRAIATKAQIRMD